MRNETTTTSQTKPNQKCVTNSVLLVKFNPNAVKRGRGRPRKDSLASNISNPHNSSFLEEDLQCSTDDDEDGFQEVSEDENNPASYLDQSERVHSMSNAGGSEGGSDLIDAANIKMEMKIEPPQMGGDDSMDLDPNYDPSDFLTMHNRIGSNNDNNQQQQDNKMSQYLQHDEAQNENIPTTNQMPLMMGSNDNMGIDDDLAISESDEEDDGNVRVKREIFNDQMDDEQDQQQQQQQQSMIDMEMQQQQQQEQLPIQPYDNIDAAKDEYQQQQQQQQQSQSTNEVQLNSSNSNKQLKLEQSKCSSCGVQILQPVKRKGPKINRCDSCVQNDQAQQQAAALAAAQQVTPTQIFVAPDGEIKFEMNELQSGNSESSMDSLNAQNMLQNHLQPVQIISTNAQGQQVQLVAQSSNQPATTSTVTATSIKRENSHGGTSSQPAKKKYTQPKVTKCNKCNGSGVVFAGSGAPASKQQCTAQSTVKTENPKPFTCNICGGTFSRYSSLWSHKKLHSGEKNYKCSICGLAFAKAVYLKNHARIHTGEKPYKCQTCGMQFSQSPHLKNHERTHSGERPYVCEVCDKGFARHATLWNHRRIHTGEKPYKCDICGSAFSQAAHLKNHAKVHSGEKPFKCDICSAAFADRFALKRHRGIHEKYGQTAPRQPAQVPQTQQNQQDNGSGGDRQQLVIQKQELPDIDDDAQHEVIISGL